MNELALLSLSTVYLIFLIRQATIFDAIREPLFNFLKKDLQKGKTVKYYLWQMLNCDLCISFHLGLALCLIFNLNLLLCLANPVTTKIIILLLKKSQFDFSR